MLSSLQCRTYSSGCLALAKAATESLPRAKILLAMSQSWSVLANQTDRYESIVKEEDN